MCKDRLIATPKSGRIFKMKPSLNQKLLQPQPPNLRNRIGHRTYSASQLNYATIDFLLFNEIRLAPTNTAKIDVNLQ